LSTLQLLQAHTASNDMQHAATVLPVQVEITGPDSKAVKSNYAAFHTFKTGRTTLSCSGLLLQLPAQQQQQQQQQQQVLHVLAPVSSLYPFLQQSQRSNLTQATAASLLPGVELSVLLQQQQESCRSTGSTAAPPQQQQLMRLPARLLQVLPLPHVLAAADGLLSSANSSGVGSWKLGWFLAGALDYCVLSHCYVLQHALAKGCVKSSTADDGTRATSRCSSGMRRGSSGDC
jgi:hypothetical protein